MEFTAPAISSSTLSAIMADAAKADPATAAAGERLVAGLDALLAAGDPRIRHAQTRHHGVGLFQRDAAGACDVQFLLLPAAPLRQCHPCSSMNTHFTISRIPTPKHPCSP